MDVPDAVLAGMRKTNDLFCSKVMRDGVTTKENYVSGKADQCGLTSLIEDHPSRFRMRRDTKLPQSTFTKVPAGQ
jgi:hypothetical protein